MTAIIDFEFGLVKNVTGLSTIKVNTKKQDALGNFQPFNLMKNIRSRREMYESFRKPLIQAYH